MPLPRIYRDRINFDCFERQFIERFRLSEGLVDLLEVRLRGHFDHHNNRNFPLSTRQHILLSLRMLADNGFMHLTGDAHGLSKQTVCRTIHNFVTTLNNTIYDEVVQFPENMDNIVNKYFDAGGMLNVCACVDGSLIEIHSPSVHEEQYVDRHGNHSINAMFVVGSNNQIFCCNSTWPGSVHDARVLRNSALFTLFETQR